VHQRAQAFVNDDVHPVAVSGQSTQQALEVIELMRLEGINAQGNAGTRVLEQTLQAPCGAFEEWPVEFPLQTDRQVRALVRRSFSVTLPAAT